MTRESCVFLRTFKIIPSLNSLPLDLTNHFRQSILFLPRRLRVMSIQNIHGPTLESERIALSAATHDDKPFLLGPWFADAQIDTVERLNK